MIDDKKELRSDMLKNIYDKAKEAEENQVDDATEYYAQEVLQNDGDDKDDEKFEHEPPTQFKIERYLRKKYEFRFNEILKDCFYRPRPKKGEDGGEFQKVCIPDLWRELALRGFNYSMSKLEATIGSNFVEKYNPFVECFEQLEPWDGEDWIKKLCRYIVLENETDSEIQRLYIMLKKWLVRCIRCALGGAINREVIMFKSDQQKIGKTSFFRYLAPKALKEYYMENPEIGNKDALISLTENLIINFDEYDKYLKEGNLPVMKSYISQDRPKVRLPYGRKQENIKRVCSCVASTNIGDFLRDETGNTRYICFDIHGFEWKEYTKIDVDKIWAQVYYLYKLTLQGKFQCELTTEEEAENDRNNLQYLYHSSEFELLQRLYEPSQDQEDFKMTTEIVEFLMNNTRFRNLTTNAVGRALTALGYKKVHSKKDNSKQGYLIKLKQDSENQLFLK